MQVNKEEIMFKNNNLKKSIPEKNFGTLRLYSNLLHSYQLERASAVGAYESKASGFIE